MRTFLSVVAIFVITVGTAHADEASKITKVREIAEVTHLKDMLDSSRNQSKEQVIGTWKEIRTQLETSFPCMPQGLWDKYGMAYERFRKEADPTFTNDEAVSVYVTLYAANMSESEVNQVLAFYKSSAGQKDIAATRVAGPKWQEWMTKQYRTAFDKSMAGFMDSVKQIIADAKKEKCK